MKKIKKFTKEEKKMAVLATPKKNSYIIKEESIEKIARSTTTLKKQQEIKENALRFCANNLNKK